MNTNYFTSNDRTSYTAAGTGPHHLMLGRVAVSRLLGGAETGGALSLVELIGAPGSGPGPHLDPWRESFYVLDGELTFRFEEDGAVRTLIARSTAFRRSAFRPRRPRPAPGDRRGHHRLEKVRSGPSLRERARARSTRAATRCAK